MGLFWAAFSKESGSYVDGGISGIWERKKESANHVDGEEVEVG